MNPFIRKLRHGAHLSEQDEKVLSELTGSVQLIERGSDILPEGAEPRTIALVLDGWAARYKQLENGKRQIISVFLNGDLCEPFGTYPRIMDDALGALTPVRLARIPLDGLRTAYRESPRIEEALWWDLLTGDAIGRERVTSLGRRAATERIGHFLCELHLRLRMIGLADERAYEMPLTQTDLADLFGLSSVHVNRSLQELRKLGLLSLRGRRVEIHDLQGLLELSMFDPAYLRQNAVVRG